MAADPSLQFIVEPVEYFRFRYRSEKGSHGGITGVGSAAKKKLYPTVKLVNFIPSGEVVIKASLYTAESEPREHVVELDGKGSKNGSCFVKLDKNMTARFNSLKFYMKTKADMHEILMKRKLKALGPRASKNKSLNQEKLREEIAEEAKTINRQSAKLCFEAFYSNELTVPLCERIFSKVINNPKDAGDLQITRLSSFTGCCTGGDEIILLCDKVKKDDIRVHFYETIENDTENMKFIGEGTFSPADVHYQYAITFRTPPYEKNEERYVKILLYRPSDKKYGDTRDFQYIADETSLRKRKRFSECGESSTSSDVNIPNCVDPYLADMIRNSTDSDSSELSLSNLDGFPSWEPHELHKLFSDTLLDDGLMLSDQTIETRSDEEMASFFLNQSQNWMYEANRFDDSADGVSFFSDASSAQSFLPSSCNTVKSDAKMFSPSRSTSTKNIKELPTNVKKVDMIKKVLANISETSLNTRDKFKQTLLHSATTKNQWKLLKHFLVRGGNPNIRNGSGENCYHLAARYNFSESLKVLLNRMSHSRKLDVLNYDGLSPLHLCVLNKSKECMELLLNRGANVNITEGKCGRTPLHLAVELEESYVHILLSHPNIDVIAEDFGGFTPVYSVCGVKEMSYEDVFEQLNSDDGDFFENSFKFLKDLYCNGELNTVVENSISTELDKNCMISNHAEILDNYPKGFINLDGDSTSHIADHSKDHQNVDSILCAILDKDYAWKTLGIYLGFEDGFLDSVENLSNGSSPTRCLINLLKKNNNGKYLHIIKECLFLAKEYSALLNDAYKSLEDDI